MFYYISVISVQYDAVNPGRPTKVKIPDCGFRIPDCFCRETVACGSRYLFMKSALDFYGASVASHVAAAERYLSLLSIQINLRNPRDLRATNLDSAMRNQEFSLWNSLHLPLLGKGQPL
jgi:hypothetical protein